MVDIMLLKCILIQLDYLMEYIEENKKDGCGIMLLKEVILMRKLLNKLML